MGKGSGLIYYLVFYFGHFNPCLVNQSTSLLIAVIESEFVLTSDVTLKLLYSCRVGEPKRVVQNVRIAVPGLRQFSLRALE